MKQCKIEGCNNPSWSKGLCRNHIPKKSWLRKNIVNIRERFDEIHEMHTFFIGIWNKRPHYSEISKEKLFSPISTVYFHHILPKEKYKEAKLDEDNIILITFDEHGNVENNPTRYEEINRRRELLKIKYKTPLT